MTGVVTAAKVSPRLCQRLALVLALAVPITCGAHDSPSGTIYLSNGDALQGELRGAAAETLSWKSDLFDGTFEIEQRYIDTVKFPAATATDATTENGPFRVATFQGDVLYGQLTGMTKTELTLASDRFGSVVLNREHVREIRQVKHTEILYDGPNWLDDWRVLKVGRRMADWTENEFGHLQTTTYGGELYRDLPEIENAEIQLLLRWNGTAAFQVDFSSAAEIIARKPSRLSIKSWTDEVVAQTSLDVTEFHGLFDITPKVKSVRLRILWNNKSGHIVICDGTGKPLARALADTKVSPSGFGVFIRNRGDDLTIEQIRVSRWNGVGPSELQGQGKSYLRLADQKLVFGSVESLDAQNETVIVRELTEVPGSSPTRWTDKLSNFPLADVALIESFSTDRDYSDDVGMQFADGNEVHGSILAIDHDRVSFESACTEDPLHLAIKGLKEIRFIRRAPMEQSSSYRLTLEDGRRFEGSFAATDSVGTLGWKPVGSRNAVALGTKSKFTLERAEIDAKNAKPLDAPQEILFLKDGTELAGVVRAMDKDTVVVQTQYANETKIPMSEMRAVEMFSASGRVSFLSPTWESLRPTSPLQKSHKRLEVSEPISIRDLSIKHHAHVTVSAAWDEKFVGLLTLHLGTQQAQNSIARFTFSRDRVIARCLQQARTRALPPFPERRVSLSIVGEGNTLRVYVNSILAFEHELKSPLADEGLWIQAGSAKGPLTRSPTDGEQVPRLVLEGLRVGRNAGMQGLDYLDQQRRNVMLQVPRDRKEHAPTHVLFASNGDVVRGRLMAVNENLVQFQTRSSQVTFDRAQVAAIVWLTPIENADEPIEEVDRPVNQFFVAMQDGSSVTFDNVLLKANDLMGRHEVFGDFIIPLDSILKIHTGEATTGLLSESFAEWRLFNAPEPRFATSDTEQGVESPLLGTLVDDVVIPMLDTSPFALRDQRGKVVVLDFWASWCAPCIRSLPGLTDTLREFPSSKLAFVAVNQGEQDDFVQAFLESHSWEMAVGVDLDESISKRFLADTIPQTVVIGPDGKVVRVFVGAPAGLHEGVAKAVADLLP